MSAPPASVAPAGDQLLLAAPSGETIWVYDCEVFSNLFLCILCDGVAWRVFDHTTIPALVAMVCDRRLVLAGFNSQGYDDQLLMYLVAHPQATTQDLFALSQRIIAPEASEGGDVAPTAWKDKPWAYSIDVLQLLNGRGSLKEWECRSGFAVVAESEADFDLPCPPELVDSVTRYCRNDVAATMTLLREYWKLVELRSALAQRFALSNRVYTYSEPKLAQTTLLTLHERRSGQRAQVVRNAALVNPDNVRTEFPIIDLLSSRLAFATPPFQDLLQCLDQGTLIGGEGRNWRFDVPGIDVGRPMALAGTFVALGIGGLHSVDRPGIDVATDTHDIVDLDATSYYPSIIISEGIAPRQLGPDFVSDMAKLRDQRLEAKRQGDKMTADALKIILNSTYGKFNDRWSPLRSVRDAHRVTLNGQLFLLMLIERLHGLGCDILSANTDGVTVRCPRALLETQLPQAIAAWEAQTGLALESTRFSRVCRRDVNSYIARTASGAIKSKGAFNPESGKGDGAIIKQAALTYLLDGIEPEATIAREQDPVAFLFYHRSKNGGHLHHGEAPLGSIVRWYASRLGEPIRRKNPNGSWATIPHGNGATLAMDITGWTRDHLADLDTRYYIAEAWKLIREIEPQKNEYQQLSFLS